MRNRIVLIFKLEELAAALGNAIRMNFFAVCTAEVFE